MLGLGRVRGHTIPGRGFNHFKLLRRRFRATGRLAAAPTHARRCAACRSAPRPSAERRRELFATTVAALPVRDLGAPRQPGHTVSGRESNLFKPLRRRLRDCGFPGEPALPSDPPAPLCRRPKRRSSRDRRPARPAFARRAAPRPIGCRLWAAGRASTERDTRPSRSGRRRVNKGRTISQSCQEIVGLFGGGRTDAGFRCETFFDRCPERERGGPARDGKSSIWLLMRRSVISTVTSAETRVTLGVMEFVQSNSERSGSNSARQASLKSRSASSFPLIISSRNSGKLTFGAR